MRMALPHRQATSIAASRSQSEKILLIQ
jgi:hypothetical protein